jgi:ATP phosphoribosyltransferase regulatory subunit
MSQSIPTGTRDILPDEMRELRAIEATLAGLFDARGYGEVATPTIEQSESLDAADGPGGSGYRFFDEAGTVLALRSDMTIPIARLTAHRFRPEEGPFRFRYEANVYRAVRPQRGQMREQRQVGIELIGPEAPGGTVEVMELLVGALDAIGLDRAVVGLGDSDLFGQVLDEYGVPADARHRLLTRLAAHDLVAIEEEVAELPGLADEQRRAIGGDALARASRRLADTYEGLEGAGIADRVQLDLGLLRELGYYTGAMFEVYDPALGHVLGGGGRYDSLLGRFGRDMPAAGFALYLERLHIAQAEEERLAGGDGS